MSHVEEVREAVRAVNGPPGSQSLDDSSLRPLLQQLARYWWVELLLGVFWVVAGDRGVEVQPRVGGHRRGADGDHVPGVRRRGVPPGRPG